MSVLTLRECIYDDSPWVRSCDVLEGGKHFLTLDIWQPRQEQWREALRLPIDGVHDDDLISDLEDLVYHTDNRLKQIRERLAAEGFDPWDEGGEQIAGYYDAVSMEGWR